MCVYITGLMFTTHHHIICCGTVGSIAWLIGAEWGEFNTHQQLHSGFFSTLEVIAICSSDAYATLSGSNTVMQMKNNPREYCLLLCAEHHFPQKVVWNCGMSVIYIPCLKWTLVYFVNNYNYYPVKILPVFRLPRTATNKRASVSVE